MEFGLRALGNRSILGDLRSPEMQSVINLKVKFRDIFKPFAPIVRRERVAIYFELARDSPYMLLVAPTLPALRLPVPPGVKGLEMLKQARSTLPAVTHVDYSARIQTVARQDNPLLYDLLLRFERATQCGVLVNTSFNVRANPSSARRRTPTAVSSTRKWIIWPWATFCSTAPDNRPAAAERRVAPQAD